MHAFPLAMWEKREARGRGLRNGHGSRHTHGSELPRGDSGAEKGDHVIAGEQTFWRIAAEYWLIRDIGIALQEGGVRQLLGRQR